MDVAVVDVPAAAVQGAAAVEAIANNVAVCIEHWLLRKKQPFLT